MAESTFDDDDPLDPELRPRPCPASGNLPWGDQLHVDGASLFVPQAGSDFNIGRDTMAFTRQAFSSPPRRQQISHRIPLDLRSDFERVPQAGDGWDHGGRALGAAQSTAARSGPSALSGPSRYRNVVVEDRFHQPLPQQFCAPPQPLYTPPQPLYAPPLPNRIPTQTPHAYYVNQHGLLQAPAAERRATPPSPMFNERHGHTIPAYPRNNMVPLYPAPKPATTTSPRSFDNPLALPYPHTHIPPDPILPPPAPPVKSWESWFATEMELYEPDRDVDTDGKQQSATGGASELHGRDVNALPGELGLPSSQPKRKRADTASSINNQNCHPTDDGDVPPAFASNKPSASQRKTKAETVSVKVPAKPESKAAGKKAAGKGSRSGKNRRIGGGSDEEIALLDEKQKQKASIDVPAKREYWTDDEKLTLVSWLTDATRWVAFRNNYQVQFLKASQTVCPEKSSDQIRRQWNYIWEVYVACRRREGHTGGGDGDDESGDDEGDGGEGYAKKDIKTEKGDAVVGKFSKAVLDKFETTSKLYKLIDAVAHRDPRVVREMQIGSHDDGGRSTSLNKKGSAAAAPGGAMAVVLDVMQSRHKQSSSMQERQFQLQENRDKREIERDRIRDEREAEQVRIQRERDDAEHSTKQWQLVEDWSKSSNKLVQKKAKALAAKLAAEEGITLSDSDEN
ncbi:hypothetical protein B0H21DRAFT_764946 [Amylocystis lapponica]|nr:hypothetical protein B0H21DRAFT_764946 [Amylocystis lapponica]